MFVVLAYGRRRIVQFNVTTHAAAAWTAQQITNAVPWDMAPRYVLRDRDEIYGAEFRDRVKAMSIGELLIAACSPWQSPQVIVALDPIRQRAVR